MSNTSRASRRPPHVEHPLGDHLPPWFGRALLWVFGSIIVVNWSQSLLVQLRSFLITLLTALFISFAVEPLVNTLAKRGWKRSRATMVAFLVIVVGGSVFAAVMVQLTISEVSGLVDAAPGYIRQAVSWINERFHTSLTADTLVEQLKKYQSQLSTVATDLGGRVLSITSSLVGGVFQFFTVLLFAYYMTSDGPKFRRAICSVLPEDKQRLVLEVWELSIDKTGGYLYSRMVLAAASSVASFIAFSAVGLPYALALAIWVGIVSQFVPVIGTYLAGVLPVLIGVLNKPVSGLIIIIFLVVYQQVENYYLSPRVTARTMDIHPAIAFGAVIIGATMLGGIGAVIALPFAAILQAFISSFGLRHEVIETELTNTVEVATVAASRSGPGSLQLAMRDVAQRLRKAAADRGWPNRDDSGSDADVEIGDPSRGGAAERRESTAGSADETPAPSASEADLPGETPGD